MWYHLPRFWMRRWLGRDPDPTTKVTNKKTPQLGDFKHFLFSPQTLGRWSNLTSIFFKLGWNRQLLKIICFWKTFRVSLFFFGCCFSGWPQKVGNEGIKLYIIREWIFTMVTMCSFIPSYPVSGIGMQAYLDEQPKSVIIRPVFFPEGIIKLKYIHL